MTDKLTDMQREAFEHAFRQTLVVDKRNEHYSEIIAEIYFLAGYRAAQSAQPSEESEFGPVLITDADRDTLGSAQPAPKDFATKLGEELLAMGHVGAQPTAVSVKLSESERSKLWKTYKGSFTDVVAYVESLLNKNK